MRFLMCTHAIDYNFQIVISIAINNMLILKLFYFYTFLISLKHTNALKIYVYKCCF